jgi:hypothetical protein
MWHCINLLSGLVTGWASRFRHILACLTKGPRQHPSSNVKDPGGQGDIENPTFGEIASYLVLNAVSSCETRSLCRQGVKSAVLTVLRPLPVYPDKQTS